MSAVAKAVDAARLDQLTQRHPGLRVQRSPAARPQEAQRWSFAALAGRLVEISGDARSAGLTLAVRLTAEAQAAGDTAAWVCSPDACFFPPDAAGHGVALEALAIVRVPTAADVAHAASRLAHSGGFGLIVLDLTGAGIWQPEQASRQGSWPLRQASGAGSGPARQATGSGSVSDAHLGRLAQQAQQHETAVVCLTRKSAQRDSLGSLVSVRAEAQCRRAGPDRFLCTVQVLKDKRNGAGWRHEEVFGGPPGLH